MLSAPLHLHLLKALEPGPTALGSLGRAVGSPPPSTMRVYIRHLSAMGVLVKQRQNEFPGSVDYALSPAGENLLAVGDVLQRWLYTAPDGPISLGSPAAKSATKALVDGWNVPIVRALAARPLALTELSRFITSINYPTLERRFGAMRAVGLIQPCSNRSGRAVHYEVTDWLRSAAGPLAAAASWEQRHLPEEASRIGRIEIESLFLLALPTLELPAETFGTCRLSVQSRSQSGGLESAGVTVSIEEGRVVSCVTRLDGGCDGGASGSFLDWIRWISNGDAQRMEVEGDSELMETLVDAMRASVFEGTFA